MDAAPREQRGSSRAMRQPLPSGSRRQGRQDSELRLPGPEPAQAPRADDSREDNGIVGAAGSGQGPRQSVVSTNITRACLRLFLPKKGYQSINTGCNQERGKHPALGEVSVKHQVRGTHTGGCLIHNTNTL